MADIILTTRNRSRKKGGSRKVGRANRKPSHKRYNAEGRREKNKAKRIAKEKKRQERSAKRKKL